MIGYGAAKAATIHIGRSLAASDSGMPKSSSVLTIAPYVDLIRRFVRQIRLNTKREKGRETD